MVYWNNANDLCQIDHVKPNDNLISNHIKRPPLYFDLNKQIGLKTKSF